MRIVSYTYGGTESYGALVGENLCLDLQRAGGEEGFPATAEEFIRSGKQAFDFARRALETGKRNETWSVARGILIPLADVRLAAPINHPSKIIAIGLNYGDHCREQNVEPPKVPVLFAKFPSSILGPGGVIRWDHRLTQMVDFEAELGVVIGQRARRVRAGEAMEYVFGYTIINDISARDLQFGDRQWVRGKSLDTFCPLGPVIATADEVPDPHSLRIMCAVNGVVMQDSNTSEMIFPVPELIEFITQGITLEPGDIIATGTPGGVGVFRKPPVYLKGGDDIVVSIERIGELRNTVEAF